MENRKRLGAQGEAIVRRHLELSGWNILRTNYRCPSGEMDIIAEEPCARGIVLVFVEVKTRRGSAQGTPLEAVDVRKQMRLSAVAGCYLSERGVGGEEPECRFDVAEVRYGADGLAKVTLHRAAFMA